MAIAYVNLGLYIVVYSWLSGRTGIDPINEDSRLERKDTLPRETAPFFFTVCDWYCSSASLTEIV